jgi:hypothetical protein
MKLKLKLAIHFKLISDHCLSKKWNERGREEMCTGRLIPAPEEPELKEGHPQKEVSRERKGKE